MDWKPKKNNKNLIEIENAIRTSQNEKETLLEEIKGHFHDPKGHFVI